MATNTHPSVLAISVGLEVLQTCISVVVISTQTIHGSLGGSRTRTDIQVRINTFKVVSMLYALNKFRGHTPPLPNVKKLWTWALWTDSYVLRIALCSWEASHYLLGQEWVMNCLCSLRLRSCVELLGVKKWVCPKKYQYSGCMNAQLPFSHQLGNTGLKVCCWSEFQNAMSAYVSAYVLQFRVGQWTSHVGETHRRRLVSSLWVLYHDYSQNVSSIPWTVNKTVEDERRLPWHCKRRWCDPAFSPKFIIYSSGSSHQTKCSYS